MAGMTGVGPVTSSFGNSRSIRLSYIPMKVVGLDRIELSTSRLSSARSNQLSYRPVNCGAPGRTRTSDLFRVEEAFSH